MKKSLKQVGVQSLMVGIICTGGASGCHHSLQKPQFTNDRGDLQITVMDVPTDTLQIAVALYQEEANFLGETSTFAATVPYDANSGSTAIVVLENLPYGSYAIIALADRDGDARLARGAFGLPKEAYGFGNDAMGLFGPPSFKKACVRVDHPTTETTIHFKQPPFAPRPTP
jgi:uncharacterized protein (DUF2141 family)